MVWGWFFFSGHVFWFCFNGFSGCANVSATVCVVWFSLWLFSVCFIQFWLVSFKFIITVLEVCPYSNVRDRQEVDLGRWGSGRIWKELVERKLKSEYILWEKISFYKSPFLKPWNKKERIWASAFQSRVILYTVGDIGQMR